MIIDMTNEKWQELLCYKGFYDFVKDVGACEMKSVSRPVIKYNSKGKEYTKNESAKNLQEKCQYLTIERVMKFPNFESYSELIEKIEDEQDWVELKAIVYAFLYRIGTSLDVRSSDKIVDCFNILFSCYDIQKLKSNKTENDDVDNSQKYKFIHNNLWEFIASEYKGKSSLSGVFGLKPDGTKIMLADYEWEFNIISRVLSVPPYPEYRIIEKYAPKPKESESQDKSPRELRADAVDSYVYTHMENSNLNDVLVKVCLVDAMYHAQLEKKANYEAMAQHIIEFRKKVEVDDLKALDSLRYYEWKDKIKEREFIDTLIDHIRFVSYKNSMSSVNGVYSFATKYLHCHNKDFPIWDSNVNKIYKDWVKYYPDWCKTFPKFPKIDELVDDNPERKYTYYDYFMYVKSVWAKILGEQHKDKDDCSLDRFDAALWSLGNKVYHFTDPDSEE